MKNSLDSAKQSKESFVDLQIRELFKDDRFNNLGLHVQHTHIQARQAWNAFCLMSMNFSREC